MDNASHILTTFDRHLTRLTRLILYGRAAVQLGFLNPPKEIAESKDVDAIIPVGDVEAFSADEHFWSAQETTNQELRPRGLYITHLFRSDQIFLRRNWEQHILPISRPATTRLKLFRPATVDLILTKMMRGDDPEDISDISFMIRHDQIGSKLIEDAFEEAILPEVTELRRAFEVAQPIVRRLANGIADAR